MKSISVLFRFFLSLNILTIFPIVLDAQSSFPFSIHNFTKQIYKAENQNWSITEDNKGYIYAANNVGLLEFDGIEWSFYPAPNNTVLRSVAVDKDNRIFTSGYKELGFWEKDVLGNFKYQSLNEKAQAFFFPNEEFWTTLILGKKIYFHSFTSLFIYDRDTFDIIRPDGIINCIGILDSSVVMHISNQGIFSVEGSEMKPVITNPEVSNSLVRFMLMTGNQDFIIGTAYNGLYRYKNGLISPFLESWTDYFAKNEINRGEVTPDGNILIGTILDGVSVFSKDGSLLYRINNQNGLQNNTILGIHNDENNNIWLAMDRGLDFISFQNDSSYSVIRADEVGAVYSAALHKGNLFLGTNQGVFYKEMNSTEKNFSFLEGTQGQTWNCNVFDNQLFINHNNGTFLLKNGRAERISTIGGGFSLIPNPKNANSLIQCSYSNIVFFNKVGHEWKLSCLLNGFNNLIRYVEVDHLNNLWASHMHRGVFYLKLSDNQDSILEQKYYGTETFGKDNNIQVFQVENRVVFTTGELIYTYDDINDTIIPFYQMNRMTGAFSASHRIVSGPNHHYWFLSKSGIALFKIEKNGFNKIKEYPIELFRDHLIIGYENIIPLSEYSGLLCLDNGYAILEADKPDLSHLIRDKQMRVKSIELSDAFGNTEKLDLNKQEIRIPFKNNSLLIKYSFPMYSNEEVMFQSFVQGIDTGWSEAAFKPEFSFKRLPSGEYIINVKASNNWLQSSRIDQMKIIILRPWYLSYLSFTIYFVIVIGVGFYFRSVMVNRYRLREQKIRETKERELIHLRNEKLDSELLYKSQELANSTMSIIKKNEFLLEIKEIIKLQKEELGLRYPDKYYQKLIRKIDNNISSIDDRKIFETHFERAHEKFLHTLMRTYPSLSPSDLRLCAYLRMNLSSKEIAPLLKISVRGVENHRYKLRKKLNLKPEENLIDFILGL